ncbi:MAG: hypothetical protein AAB801_02375 [Patescibacteria group bacterium]
MKELDSARQRITETEQEFETIKPLLLQIEAEFLGGLPPRFKALFQEVKEEIAAQEGVQLRENIDYYYSYSGCERSRFRHYFTGVGKEVRQDWWQQGETDKMILNEYGKPCYYSDNRFSWKLRVPELLLKSVRTKGQDWIRKNVAIHEVYFKYSFEQVRETEKGLNGILFHIVENGKWITFKRLSSEEEPPAFDLTKDEDINSLAEELARFIARKGYLRQDDKGKKSLKNTNSSIPLTQEPPVGIAPEQTPSPDNLDVDQWKRIQEDERDRVLFLIEGREATDSNYSRPSWIHQEERSQRGLHGLPPTEYDQFPSEESFDAALSRHFPSLPDH